MSKESTNGDGVVWQAKELVHTFLGSKQDASGPEDEVVVGHDGSPDNGITGAVAESGYGEQVSRLLREGREREADIVELVGQQGGFIRQKELAEAMPCSPTVVSRRLQSMERAGLVDRIPRGREKIVCLPGLAPDERR